MQKKMKNKDNALLAICSVEALMYERNQAYAFIAMQGHSNEFLKFTKNKLCERTTNEELKALIKRNIRRNERT